MSFLDGVFNAFRLPGDDEYDDEYDDYNDDYDDEIDDEPVTKRKLFAGSKKKAEFDDYDEPAPAATNAAPASRSSKKVVPIKSASTRGLEVVVIRPESMEDASEITDTLLCGKAVVLNLEGIEGDIPQRIIDYSSGSCYAMRGNLQRVTGYIFLVTPPNVDVSGDFPDIVNGGIDLATFAKSQMKF